MNLYDKVGASDRYDAARSLPEASLKLWLDEIKNALPIQPRRGILDLGCGTGRFTEALQRTFRCRVIGVDPSSTMLERARLAGAPDVEWAQGSAESIPLPAEDIDCVFMSQAYHHIKDVPGALREVGRVLASGGYFMIRNGTQESSEDALWLKFFPSAAELDRARMPKRVDVIAQAERHGFKLLTQKCVVQRFAESYRQYCDKIGGRGLSALIAISDKDFAEGMENLRSYCEEQPADLEVLEQIDLFVFQLE
jgi:ubiquinone/menaquinone biosynthesis C-methylase UbiE